MDAIRKMSYEELRDAEKRNQKLLSNRYFVLFSLLIFVVVVLVMTANTINFFFHLTDYF